jgi:hypothetical protein
VQLLQTILQVTSAKTSITRFTGWSIALNGVIGREEDEPSGEGISTFGRPARDTQVRFMLSGDAAASPRIRGVLPIIQSKRML